MTIKSLTMSVLVLLAASACATTQPPAVSQSGPAAPKVTATRSQQSVACVSDTATRLPARPGECSAFGSTYTQQDLDRTGQPFAQDALRMLDPSVTVHP